MKNYIIIGTLLMTATQVWAGSAVTIQKATVVKEDGAVERLILGDETGLSLYTFEPDRVDESTCYDACAKAWPPVLISKENVGMLQGSLAVVPRKDGSLQLTINRRPVYLFAGDQNPGDINGEGLGDVWFLIDVKFAN